MKARQEQVIQIHATFASYVFCISILLFQFRASEFVLKYSCFIYFQQGIYSTVMESTALLLVKLGPLIGQAHPIIASVQITQTGLQPALVCIFTQLIRFATVKLWISSPRMISLILKNGNEQKR